jgi:UDP-glucose 4-epimerase
MNQLMQGQPMTIFGDGEQTRAFTDVRDVAPVIADSPFVTRALNQIFNVGADTPYTVNQLAEIVAEAMGVPAQVNHIESRNEVKDAFASHEKMHEIFGYRSRYSLEEGIETMARWARAVGSRRSSIFTEVEVTKNMPISWQRELPQFQLEKVGA